MSDIADLMSDYLAALHAAGIRAVIDGRDINPPAVQLRPPVMRFRFGRGCVGADWVARLVMPNNGQENAFNTALDLIPAIQDALGGVIVTATPTEYDAADGGGPLPGYDLAWSTH